jgi:hypothetical protein
MQVVAVFALSLIGLVSTDAMADEGLPDGQGHVYEDVRLVVVETTSKEESVVVQQLGQLLACRASFGAQPYLMDEKAVEELDRLGIRYVVEHENMQEAVEQRAREFDAIRAQRGVGFFDVYRTLAEIEAHFDTLVAAEPIVITKVNVGTSIEGRTIWGYRILAPDAVADPVRVVINGTQHAREWLSPMTNTYIATELVNAHGSDAAVTDMLREVEVVILPVVNPDGFVYTHTTERFWRKNRRNNGGGFFGVDLNRNWGHEWNGGLPGSSDGTPSSDIYRGTAPFSEPETAAVSTFIASMSDVRGHIDFHTYGQWILGPWGYNDTITPPRESELRVAQEQMASAILSAEGLVYVAGLGTDQLLYTADGVMPDWTFGDQGALAWTIELRPTGSGLGPFDPDASNILPAAREGLAALMDLTEIVQRDFEFTFPQGRPAIFEAASGGSVSTTLVRWHELEIVPGSARIATRIGNAGAFTETAMSGVGDDYDASLPVAPCGSTVEYYFLADKAGGGTVYAPTDAPASVFSADAVDLTATFSDDFETDTGWAVSGTVADGQWERGVPINNNRGDPPADSDSSGQCFLTDNQNDNGTNSDVDGGTTMLTSPVFDVTDGGTVSYSYWLDGGPGTIGTGDGLTVDVATNAAGTNWAPARSYTLGQFAWRTDSISFGPGGEFASSATVRLRFGATDTGTGNVVECGLDAVGVISVNECPVVACEGDANGDNTVDVNDISYVLFRLGDSGAPGTVDGDANEDGIVDVNDISYVLFRLGPCV